MLRIEHCRSCAAPIVWLKTAAGKHMPTDRDTVEAADTRFDPDKHRAHFATCPQADKWRRRREKSK